MKKIISVFLLAIALIMPSSRAEIFYPWKEYKIGSLDLNSWAGLFFATPRENFFAFTLRVKRNNEIAESKDFYYLVAELGPQSPDGQYARISFDLGLPFKMGPDTPIFLKPPPKKQVMRLEWSRRDERTVIGRIFYPRNIEVSLVHYLPWNIKGEYRLQGDGTVLGTSGDNEKEYYMFWSHRQATHFQEKPEELVLSYKQDGNQTIFFAATVGSDFEQVSNKIYRYKNEVTISAIIDEEINLYEKKRVKIKGLYENAEIAVTNNMHWTVSYQSGLKRLYTPAGRGWIFPNPDGAQEQWAIFNWNSFLNSLVLSVESTKLALDAVKAVLETQYSNGNIPNWRAKSGGTPDRSQPPIGSFVVLKLFQKTGDTEFLKYCYPYLKKWHDFWTARKPNGQPRRDGNSDGLLEWGSDAEMVSKRVPAWEKNVPGLVRAAWESGQDDLPNWDDVPFNEETGTMRLNCVDLNSLYALDAMCLSEIALILNYNNDAENYRAQYEKIKALINKELWNEKEGFYFDRFWDGRFSVHKAASNFYPLLALIPNQQQAQKLLKHLLDPKKFWGEFVIPTISRDDPAFRPENQQYTRGSILPPINYLVYQGLKAYGADAVASELAKKSVDMFLRTWKNFQICPENFNSLTGEAGGQRFQSWGSLLALIALEEYIDFTPWDGFRFGILKPEKYGRISRLQIQGRHYEVTVSPSETTLSEEGRKIITANKGAIFRKFLYSENEVSFEIKTLETTSVKINFLRKGKYQIIIDGREVDIFVGNTRKITVPEGVHPVVFQLLAEKQD